MKRLALTLCIILFTAGAISAEDTFVTVYGSNLGLVTQTRTVDTTAAKTTLRIGDVAAGIIPDSVILRPLKKSSTLKITEQTFEYDLAHPDRVLEKNIGKSIEFLTGDGDYVQGTLVNAYDDSFLVQTDEGVRIIPRNDELSINIRQLPEGLVMRPTLMWSVVGLDGENRHFELSYLTTGISWDASYVAILNEKSDSMQLDAWASIRNDCGVDFTNAKLKLVAGEVKTTPEPPPEIARMKGAGVMAAAQYDEAQSFEQSELFEYYVYELDRPVTLNDKTSKQIVLRPQATVKIEKQFVYNHLRHPEGVEVVVSFNNDKESGLGEPLPAGVFRIYESDASSLVFLGEHHLNHTARNKKVKNSIGNAFDLSAKRNIMESGRISERSERQTIAIELRNSKKTADVVVKVEETMAYRSWKLEDHSHAYEKKDAQNVEFFVPVAADSVTTLRYTVIYTW